VAEGEEFYEPYLAEILMYLLGGDQITSEVINKLHFLAIERNASPVEGDEGQSSNQKNASEHALWQQLSVETSFLPVI
jgi:hypothetical protein